MTDQQIILGLRQNDRQTTEYIYKTMGPSVLRYILSNSGTRDDAKDFFQEAFIKVLMNVRGGKYDSRQKFEGYFMTIAKNTWLDNLRRKKEKYVDDDDDSLLKLADDSDEEALLQLILHDKRLDVLNTVWESDTWCTPRSLGTRRDSRHLLLQRVDVLQTGSRSAWSCVTLHLSVRQTSARRSA